MLGVRAPAESEYGLVLDDKYGFARLAPNNGIAPLDLQPVCLFVGRKTAASYHFRLGVVMRGGYSRVVMRARFRLHE